MRARVAVVLIGILAGAAFAVGRFEDRTPTRAVTAGLAAEGVQDPQGPGLSRAEFGALIERISEPGGYFDTDNLISNESSYLHVLGALEQFGARGGAYIGVGPGQNFSYIARTRPDIAFIIDVRRDNLLQHLWFKALFELAPTRVEFLSLMLGRKPPADARKWDERPLERIIREVSRQRATRESRDDARARVIEAVDGFGLDLSMEDLATIGRIHARFAEAGFELRFTSFGRPPRPFYPTFGDLLLETDIEGRHANYLATEDDYAFVRNLERRNLVIPVVGDLAGPTALVEIGNVLRERGANISAFYVSNVEFYLMQDGTFARFARNVAGLPASERSVLIRSVFGQFYAHPQNMPGYYSTQLLQTISSLVNGFEAGLYRTYDDLVYGELVPVRLAPASR